MTTTHSIRLRVFEIALSIAWAAVSLVALLEATPDSPLAFGTKTRAGLISVLPQGWNFFTRNAREERLLLYEPREGGWQLRSITNAQAKHWFGIKRTSSLISVELMAITSQIPEDAWVALESTMDTSVQEKVVPRKISNPGVSRTLCGHFLLRKQLPLPWAWADSPRLKELPSRVAVIDTSCDS